ncbi:MAG: zinc ribbon domain-containing protein, partial [Chloroflexota bacterium]
MIIVSSILLVLAALYFVTYPIFRPKVVQDVPDDSTLRDLVAQKDTLYSTLAELKMDYEMGNLSPGDHAQLEEKYKEKAVGVLKRLDMAGEDSDLDADIEREVARMRRGRRRPAAREVDVGEAIEQEILRLRQKPARALANCPNCGHELVAAAKFCPDCG